MGNVVEFEVFRDTLGVGATDPDVDQVSLLFEAINAEIRRLTHRAFEGDGGGSYDEVLRVFGDEALTLPWTPVRTVTSINPQRFDGTDEEALAATDWRLEDPARGRIRLRRAGAEYLHVVWTTTGEIPDQLPWACLEWGRDRWTARERPADLASYSTGGDAESYFAAVAGVCPPKALAAILAVAHHDRGGVI